MEPAPDLSGIFSEPFFGFVEADPVEDEAAGRARVIGENPGGN
jgi:hypothetical protein